MRIHTWLLFGLLGASAQVPGPAPIPGPDCLTPVEKIRLQTESKLDNRIKIYGEVCARCTDNLSHLIQQQQLQEVPALLQSWIEMLEASLKDIEASPGRKDKSRALVRYEIRLRKAIGTVQESKIKTNLEQQDQFERWLAQAETIRKKLVVILFPK
jgi:hypothetical protein